MGKHSSMRSGMFYHMMFHTEDNFCQIEATSLIKIIKALNTYGSHPVFMLLR